MLSFAIVKILFCVFVYVFIEMFLYLMIENQLSISIHANKAILHPVTQMNHAK